jgi:hypothetical protein
MSAAPGTAPLVDVAFVIDATSSTTNVFRALSELMLDEVRTIQKDNKETDLRYAVVAYRDPVDDHHNRPGYRVILVDGAEDPPDRHDVQQFTAHTEAVQEFMANVKSYGGWDEPEDWAGALDIALHTLEWRSGKKCIFWITDANAHGSRFSNEARDPHDDQIERLVALVQEMARERIYFIGMNIKKGRDGGCEKTLAEIEKIYRAAGGPSFVAESFRPDWNDGEFDGEEWSPEVMAEFEATISRSLQRHGRRF